MENTSGIEEMIAFDVSRSKLTSSTDDPNGDFIEIHPCRKEVGCNRELCVGFPGKDYKSDFVVVRDRG